jgi:transposase-like protein
MRKKIRVGPRYRHKHNEPKPDAEKQKGSGRRMPAAKLRQILALLADGMPMARIARRLGVSPTTIAEIRDGAVGPQQRGRCLGCGHVVTLPCRACELRAVVATGDAPPRLPADDPADAQALRLGLSKRENVRRLELRAAMVVRGWTRGDRRPDPVDVVEVDSAGRPVDLEDFDRDTMDGEDTP